MKLIEFHIGNILLVHDLIAVNRRINRRIIKVLINIIVRVKYAAITIIISYRDKLYLMS